MKRLYFKFVGLYYTSKSCLSIIIMTFILMMSGCSDNMEDIPIVDSNTTPKVANIHHNVSKTDAIDIANKVLKKTKTRSSIMSSPTFEYVVSENRTRSVTTPDTLAYILNYPDNEGFVIVATNRRVYPVLGFADKGNFSFENDNAKNNFIDNIETYIESTATDTLYDVTDNDFDGCYIVSPMVQISLSQGSPWNKYVIQEHPNCPAGCVAVATALVMSHSNYEINYHNSTYHLKSIITAINKGPNNTSANAPKRIMNGEPTPPIQPVYTYEQAVDSMAKLLYWIGKDINMDYKPDGSGASSSDAYQLCKSLNFSIPSGYASFDIKKVTQYLKDNHIVYLRGYEISGKGGHAWVSDACYFCVNMNDHTQILDTYIHCDWGWGGSCNGYYSGSVFEASNYKFKPVNYFAIKREWQ